MLVAAHPGRIRGEPDRARRAGRDGDRIARRGRVPRIVARDQDDRFATGVCLRDRALASEQLELRRRERPTPQRLGRGVPDLDGLACSGPPHARLGRS